MTPAELNHHSAELLILAAVLGAEAEKLQKGDPRRAKLLRCAYRTLDRSTKVRKRPEAWYSSHFPWRKGR